MVGRLIPRGGFTHGMTHGDPELAVVVTATPAWRSAARRCSPSSIFIDLAQPGRKAPFFLWYAR